MKRKKIIKKITDFVKLNEHLIMYYPFELNPNEVNYVYKRSSK
jgi:hypothetical protein